MEPRVAPPLGRSGSVPRPYSDSIDVRWHGRGGQGVVVASQIVGCAAFLAGRHVQVFPEFGVERRGAPVRAFLRLDDHPIRIRSAIQQPHCVVVLDPMLLAQEETWAGTTAETSLLYNSRGAAWTLPRSFRHVTAVNATRIAVRHGLGTATTPIVNTAMAGFFARVSGLIDIDPLCQAIEKYCPIRTAENVRAAQEAFEEAVPWT